MLRSVREVFRFRIRATDGKLGKADDFYFSEDDWSIKYVVVNTGRWFPSDRVLLGPERFERPDPLRRTISVELTKVEVTARAGSDSEEPLSSRQQKLMQERYGGSLYSQGGGPIGVVHGVEWGQALALAEAERPALPSAVPQTAHEPRSTREVIGYKIEAVDGPLGRLEDFLLEDDDWTLRYLVINRRDVRVPNPRVLAPPSWVQYMSWSESRIHMRVQREKIKRSQRYDPLSHSSRQKPKPFIWP